MRRKENDRTIIRYFETRRKKFNAINQAMSDYCKFADVYTRGRNFRDYLEVVYKYLSKGRAGTQEEIKQTYRGF